MGKRRLLDATAFYDFWDYQLIVLWVNTAPFWHWLSTIFCVLSDNPECGGSKEDENEVQTAIGETTNTGKLP